MTDTTSIIALVLSLTLSLGALAVLVRAQRDKAERLQKRLVPIRVEHHEPRSRTMNRK